MKSSEGMTPANAAREVRLLEGSLEALSNLIVNIDRALYSVGVLDARLRGGPPTVLGEGAPKGDRAQPEGELNKLRDTIEELQNRVVELNGRLDSLVQNV